jgi:hypothetical protein
MSAWEVVEPQHGYEHQVWKDRRWMSNESLEGAKRLIMGLFKDGDTVHLVEVDGYRVDRTRDFTPRRGSRIRRQRRQRRR